MDVIGQEGAIKRITAGNPGMISVSIQAAATTGSVIVLIGRASGTVILEELISQLPCWQIMGTVNSTSAGKSSDNVSFFAVVKKNLAASGTDRSSILHTSDGGWWHDN